LEVTLGKKLYVGNLPFTATEANLTEIFTQAGKVESARIIVDRASGRSKGFGFVEMASDEDAAKAISQFNGADYGGRPMTVSEARPQEPREGGGFGGGGGGGRGGYGGGGGRGGRGGGGGGGGRGRY
jgi:RNA recognition motif-containing protein